MGARLDQRKIDAILELHRGGMAPAMIETATGVGHAAVHRVIRQYETERLGEAARGKTMQLQQMKELVPHPVCLRYLQLTPDGLEALGDDIERNGQRHPVLVQGGFVIDGRNRWMAMLARGIPMRYEEVPEGADVEALARSLNDMRRHDGSPSVKAMAAADSLNRPGGKARDEAAERFGVSSSYVYTAEKIKEADPAVADEVRAGRKDLQEAKKELGIGRPRGQTRINGVLSDDPPDIAARRAAGKIGDGVIPDVQEEHDPTTVEGVREDIEERAAIQQDIPDEEWLAALPLFGVLTGTQRKRFRTAALRFRHLEQPRKAFAWHAARVAVQGGSEDPYSFLLKRFLGVEPPDRWKRCCEPVEGGCGGSGVFKVGDASHFCPKCHGNGFWIL